MKWNKTNCHKTTNVLLISSRKATFTWSTNISCFRALWFYCSQNFKIFSFPIFWLWAYLMKVIPETLRNHYICYLRFYYYHWVGTSVCGLLVPHGIIRPVISALALTWFNRYIYYWNLHLRNNVIISITKVLF